MRQRRIWEQPQYRRQHQDAQQHQCEANRDTRIVEGIRGVAESVARIREGQNASYSQAAKYERSKKKRDNRTVIALVVAAAVALGGIVVTHRDTLKAIRETHTAADQQHADTLAALVKNDATVAAMKEQADATRGQLDEMRAQQRPWIYVVGIPEIYGGLEIIPSNGAQIHLRFSLQKSGHIPANDTKIALRFINNANGWPFDRENEQRLACDVTAKKDTWVSANVTVFPGRLKEVETVAVMDQRSVEIAAKGIKPPDWQHTPIFPGILSPFVLGCIQYRFGGGNGWHITPLQYYVSYVTPPGQPKDSRFAIPFSDTHMTIPT